VEAGGDEHFEAIGPDAGFSRLAGPEQPRSVRCSQEAALEGAPAGGTPVLQRNRTSPDGLAASIFRLRHDAREVTAGHRQVFSPQSSAPTPHGAF
jgi:hypothetical protein